jgi:hypothetical protein
MFWREIDSYDVYISEVVVRELSKCDGFKAEKMIGFISGIQSLLDKTDDIFALAAELYPVRYCCQKALRMRVTLPMR